MPYFAMLVLGLVGGGAIVYVLLDSKRRQLQARESEYEARAESLQTALAETAARQEQNLQAFAITKKELDQERERLQREVTEKLSRLKEQLEAEKQTQLQALASRRRELDEESSHVADEAAALDRRQREFNARAVSYGELSDENLLLKRDLQNLDVNLRKLQLDTELQREKQQMLDKRAQEVGARYLQDSVKWIGNAITANNFVACKQRLLKVIEWCRDIGFEVSPAEESTLVSNLKGEYERVVRAAFEREEQARIKAQIREDQLLQKEVERELKQLERERAAIQAALDQALAKAKDEHSAEVDRLRARLAEAEAKAQRATSQAQLTKAGHVYVISNIGSFGKDVFKVGMTRRLEPLDRVRELGDASVPFPFDVHMMISCTDAPLLENALHRELHKTRLNRLNPRKEFFRADIEAIRRIVEQHHGEVQYVADPEALEYNQSLSMSDEDAEYVEEVYDELEEEKGAASTPDA